MCFSVIARKNEMKQKHIERVDVVIRRLLEMTAVGMDLAIELLAAFPEGADGDRAREMLPRAAQMSHDRLCTVSRTVELGTPVDTHIAPPAG